MTTTVYPISGYPTVHLTEDGEQMTLRPMAATDQQALLEFFKRVPEKDRYYLKENVTDPAVIQRWSEQLDYSRALPLLAFLDDKIVGDGTLHHSRSGSRKHVGEVRVVVDPEYRNRGVGRGLLYKLIDLAGGMGLKKLTFEIVGDVEEAARHTAILLGFVPVAVLPGHVQDITGETHDLIILERVLMDPALSADEELLVHHPVF